MPVTRFPPLNPVYLPEVFSQPPVHIPPPPPVPCDYDVDNPDPDCSDDPHDPEDPPKEVPEPGVIVILLAGLCAYQLRKKLGFGN